MKRRTPKKPIIKINNRLRGSFGETEIRPKKPAIVEIDVKKHKGDTSELADTIKHELMHVAHPKMFEKTVYKKMSEKSISPDEQRKLLAKIRTKKIHYKVGAAKRRFKISKNEKVEPGDLITKINAQKTARNKGKTDVSPLKVAFMGAM